MSTGSPAQGSGCGELHHHDRHLLLAAGLLLLERRRRQRRSLRQHREGAVLCGGVAQALRSRQTCSDAGFNTSGAYPFASDDLGVHMMRIAMQAPSHPCTSEVATLGVASAGARRTLSSGELREADSSLGGPWSPGCGRLVGLKSPGCGRLLAGQESPGCGRSCRSPGRRWPSWSCG